MLTEIKIDNFKLFEHVEFDLGDPVVFIGPNNSGKTTALQALALWNTGLENWERERRGEKNPEKRPGVSVNRREVFSIPTPSAKLLWNDLQVRKKKGEGAQNVRINVIVKGYSNDEEWTCGLEFDYANEESFYVRPMRRTTGESPERMPIPPQAYEVDVAFLPPMSGLTSSEDKLTLGSINKRIGEGRTSEVLRNLCYQLYEQKPEKWNLLIDKIESLFGARLSDPEFFSSTGEIEMSYEEFGNPLDLSSSGGGLQQTTLVLSYMLLNPQTVLLLDEPDAHLEILRQQQIYQTLSHYSSTYDSQIIAASHSEVLLNEAAQQDVVVAFVGQPHRIDDQESQIRKALADIGFEDYYKAEQKGWVLYLEGSTDYAILEEFARLLDHEKALEALERPFLKYTENEPGEAERHFYGVQEAYSQLTGFAIYDSDVSLPGDFGGRGLSGEAWDSREIENYFCTRETLLNFAEAEAPGKMFEDSYLEQMKAAIEEVEEALETLDSPSPWGEELKVSEEFLPSVLDQFYENLSLPNRMKKKDFHELVKHLPPKEVNDEVKQILDRIADTSQNATPVEDQ